MSYIYIIYIQYLICKVPAADAGLLLHRAPLLRQPQARVFGVMIYNIIIYIHILCILQPVLLHGAPPPCLRLEMGGGGVSDGRGEEGGGGSRVRAGARH